jgi:hypothetical protein
MGRHNGHSPPSRAALFCHQTASSATVCAAVVACLLPACLPACLLCDDDGGCAPGLRVLRRRRAACPASRPATVAALGVPGRRDPATSTSACRRLLPEPVVIRALLACAFVHLPVCSGATADAAARALPPRAARPELPEYPYRLPLYLNPSRRLRQQNGPAASGILAKKSTLHRHYAPVMQTSRASPVAQRRPSLSTVIAAGRVPRNPSVSSSGISSRCLAFLCLDFRRRRRSSQLRSSSTRPSVRPFALGSSGRQSLGQLGRNIGASAQFLCPAVLTNCRAGTRPAHESKTGLRRSRPPSKSSGVFAVRRRGAR